MITVSEAVLRKAGNIAYLNPALKQLRFSTRTHFEKNSIYNYSEVDTWIQLEPVDTTPVDATQVCTRLSKRRVHRSRRRLRKLQWLTSGGPKPEDTDSD